MHEKRRFARMDPHPTTRIISDLDDSYDPAGEGMGALLPPGVTAVTTPLEFNELTGCDKELVVVARMVDVVHTSGQNR